MRVRRALLGMHLDPTGSEVLSMLKLDAFAVADPSTFDGILRRMAATASLPREPG